MASPVVADDHSNMKSEEGTTIFNKKRSRRVSFAENTSVHIFDRDEEIQTPPDPDAPNSPNEELGFSDRVDEPKQFFGNDEEDNEDEDTDGIGPTSPFFRVVRSPSSGGSTIGSVTSNDEDNFFGPVSAKFIRRDLSDSVTSDGNHDQTLDSTTFSMRFNSIARSNSEADLKTFTATGNHLSFVEKTPTSSMLLTLNEKPNCQPDASTSKFSIGSQSNDMSLVGEYHDKYDYGKLSPASNAQSDLHMVSHISVLKTPLKDGKQFLANKENESNLMVFEVDGVMEKENKSPLIGQMLLNDFSLYKSPRTVTPHNQPSFFLTTESQKHDRSVSFSSLQKSISKLRILEAFPFSASLNAKLENSNPKSLLGISKMTPLGILEKNTTNRDLYSVLQNDKIDPLPMENAKSSSVNQFFNRDVTSATRKRKTEDIKTEKIARIKWSLEFFIETKLLSQSVDKMDLHTIDRLFDILEQLQMSKTYELLSNEIQSKTILDPSSNIQKKREAETRLLLCKIVHEKAKLQLMHVKREKLLKNMQSLAAGIQESEALKLNYSPQSLLNPPVIYHHFFSENTKDLQECQVASLRQEVKDMDKKISNLIESFHISCKVKQEADSADLIAFVKNHLMKRAQCQIIRKEFQLWALDDLKSSKYQHYVVLNYLDLMTQSIFTSFYFEKYHPNTTSITRFTITLGVVASISVFNILKETNILKNFKDMDALTAFRFVFNAGLTQKHIGHTNLAHETQMTSSLLGNLVDVMEEIQLGRIELKNLIHARFHTSSDEQLHLELYFFDSITRKTATITLNTSCLKRGIYPSEIVSSLSDEIAIEIKDLRLGFLWILRLCKCVSQVISRSR